MQSEKHDWINQKIIDHSLHQLFHDHVHSEAVFSYIYWHEQVKSATCSSFSIFIHFEVERSSQIKESKHSLERLISTSSKSIQVSTWTRKHLKYAACWLNDKIFESYNLCFRCVLDKDVFKIQNKTYFNN